MFGRPVTSFLLVAVGPVSNGNLFERAHGDERVRQVPPCEDKLVPGPPPTIAYGGDKNGEE
jgi:hypothetical protein